MSKPTELQMCSICIGPVKAKAVLDTCFHYFCFTCIKKWSKNQNTCPLCKNRFRSITKQAQSPKTKTIKKQHKRQKVVKTIDRNQKQSEDQLEASIEKIFCGSTRSRDQKLLYLMVELEEMIDEQ